MLLTLKTFHQQTFTVEIELHQKVLNLKEKIESLKGEKEYPVWRQKLIYSGQILCDDSLLSEYSFDKNKFIVVMISTTVRVPPKPALNEPGFQRPSTSQDTNYVSAAIAAPIAESHAPLSPISEESDGYNMAAAIEQVEFLEATEFQEKVEKIVGMGYQKVDVEVSLIANSGNVERAVEYLIDEIPLDLLNDSFSLDEDEDSVPTGIGAKEREEKDPFRFLKTQPAFQQMTVFLRENPSFFSAVLQQIGATNPALLQIISQHQEEFVTLVNEESILDSSLSSTAGVHDEAEEQMSEVTKILPTDQEAIDRLKCLHVPNFPEKFVTKVYVAFEKNEKLATKFLLSTDE